MLSSPAGCKQQVFPRRQVCNLCFVSHVNSRISLSTYFKDSKPILISFVNFWTPYNNSGYIVRGNRIPSRCHSWDEPKDAFFVTAVVLRLLQLVSPVHLNMLAKMRHQTGPVNAGILDRLDWDSLVCPHPNTVSRQVHGSYVSLQNVKAGGFRSYTCYDATNYPDFPIRVGWYELT
jgi:hypothetical protein